MLLLRRGENWDGWLAAVWEGRGGIGKKKEKQRKRVSAEWVYIGFYRRNHRRTRSVDIPVGDSTGGSVTSLYGYLDLNPLVIPSVKSSEKIHVIILLQLSKKTVSSVSDTVGIYRRYLSVNTDRFWDRIISVSKNFRWKISVGNSVGFLRFSGSD